MHSSTSSSDASGMYKTRMQKCLKIQKQFHEEVGQMPLVKIPATLPSLSKPESRGVPYSQMTEEKTTWDGLQTVLCDM